MQSPIYSALDDSSSPTIMGEHRSVIMASGAGGVDAESPLPAMPLWQFEQVCLLLAQQKNLHAHTRHTDTQTKRWQLYITRSISCSICACVFSVPSCVQDPFDAALAEDSPEPPSPIKMKFDLGGCCMA